MLGGARPNAPVAQSLLDRLINENPKAKTEAPMTVAASLRKFREGVRRDLEALLNTRSIAIRPPESFRELNRSVYVYGLPDLSSFSMGNPDDRERLQRAIQSVVRLFERRIADARVILTESDSAHTVNFRIEGILRVEPAEPVTFDTVLRLSSGSYEVKGERNGG